MRVPRNNGSRMLKKLTLSGQGWCPSIKIPDGELMRSGSARTVVVHVNEDRLTILPEGGLERLRTGTGEKSRCEALLGVSGSMD